MNLKQYRRKNLTSIATEIFLLKKWQKRIDLIKKNFFSEHRLSSVMKFEQEVDQWSLHSLKEPKKLIEKCLS